MRYLLVCILAACAHGPATPDQTPSAIDRAAESVVRLLAPNRACSAVMVAPRVALTAKHCVDDVPSAILVPLVGHAVAVDGAILDSDRDLAILHTASDLPGPFATPRIMHEPDELVISVGGCAPTRKTHRVTATLAGVAVARGKLAVCPGDSGGAWFDTQGRLVGVTSQRSDPRLRTRQSSAVTMHGVEGVIADLSRGA